MGLRKATSLITQFYLKKSRKKNHKSIPVFFLLQVGVPISRCSEICDHWCKGSKCDVKWDVWGNVGQSKVRLSPQIQGTLVDWGVGGTLSNSYLPLTLKTLTRMHIKRLYICLASNLEHRRPQMVCPHQIYIEDMAHVVGEESSLGIQKMMLGLPIIDKYCDQIF